MCRTEVTHYSRCTVRHAAKMDKTMQIAYSSIFPKGIATGSEHTVKLEYEYSDCTPPNANVQLSL